MSSKGVKFKDASGNAVYPCPYFPVGSIYISVTNVNPSTYFGGTWVAFGTGRTLVGVDTSQTEFNTIKKTGGSKATEKHSHTRGTMEITGSFRFNDDYDNAGVDASASGTGAISGVNGSGSGSGVAGTTWNVAKGFDFKASNNWTGATSEFGTGNSGNLQPYITVYMWERTA